MASSDSGTKRVAPDEPAETPAAKRIAPTSDSFPPGFDMEKIADELNAIADQHPEASVLIARDDLRNFDHNDDVALRYMRFFVDMDYFLEYVADHPPWGGSITLMLVFPTNRKLTFTLTVAESQ